MHDAIWIARARKLGVDASYVSRVARGERTSERIFNAILSELRRIEKQY